MTLSEVQSSLALAKAAYNASLKGEQLSWEGRSIKMKDPDFYWNEIIRLERIEAQLQNGRKGHNVSLADFSNPQ